MEYTLYRSYHCRIFSCDFVVKRQYLLPLAKTPTKGSTTSTALRRFFTRALQLLPFDNKMGAESERSFSVD